MAPCSESVSNNVVADDGGQQQRNGFEKHDKITFRPASGETETT